ncbi:hypothetical protein CRD60_04520 [Bifidobacterium aemilianum]|uniref:ParB-like N-terminal domain-containing protein n=1 Tax=Bifidobacterium aemilianum TaxID=2493120 RepID=A0A366K7Y9_9BIFI|nr:ParB/RepB/Spo0J family partition protein [Bifidobacterium aemilianum]RBP97855.1 hypothetical protein CRD60_04520 [Bifidobacterium aemilianum]
MTTTTTIEMLPIEAITPNPANPRTQVGDITELALSIAAQGIQQPLLVTPAGPDGTHTLVIGHRRLAAAKQTGLDKVPCTIKAMDDTRQAELMIVENVHRENLTAMDEAQGYARLLDLGEDTDTMARTTGRSATTVRRRLKIAAISPEARKDLPPQLSFDQLEAIADFADDPHTQDELIAAAGTDNWNMALTKARTTREAAQWSHTIRQAADEAGLDIVELEKGNLWAAPDDWRYIEKLTPDLHPDPQEALSAWLDQHPGQRPDAVGIIESDRSWVLRAILMRAITPQEKEEAQRAHQEWEDARARRQAELDALMAPAKDLGRTSRQLRIEHTRHLLGLKRPPKTMADALGTMTVLRITQDQHQWVIDDRLERTWRDMAGKDTPMPQPFGDPTPSLSAFALCHAWVEEAISDTAWRSADEIDTLLEPLYQALEATGYKPSDEERAALNGSLLADHDPDEDTDTH